MTKFWTRICTKKKCDSRRSRNGCLASIFTLLKCTDNNETVTGDVAVDVHGLIGSQDNMPHSHNSPCEIHACTNSGHVEHVAWNLLQLFGQLCDAVKQYMV